MFDVAIKTHWFATDTITNLNSSTISTLSITPNTRFLKTHVAGKGVEPLTAGHEPAMLPLHHPAYKIIYSQPCLALNVDTLGSVSLTPLQSTKQSHYI